MEPSWPSKPPWQRHRKPWEAMRGTEDSQEHLKILKMTVKRARIWNQPERPQCQQDVVPTECEVQVAHLLHRCTSKILSERMLSKYFEIICMVLPQINPVILTPKVWCKINLQTNFGPAAIPLVAAFRKRSKNLHLSDSMVHISNFCREENEENTNATKNARQNTTNGSMNAYRSPSRTCCELFDPVQVAPHLCRAPPAKHPQPEFLNNFATSHGFWSISSC